MNKAKQAVVLSNLVQSQMEQILQKRMEKGFIFLKHRKLKNNIGSSESETLLHLKNFFKGEYTKDSIDTFNRLLVEANTNLGLLKLPPQYKKYSKMIRSFNLQICENETGKSLDDLANIALENTKPITIKPSEIIEPHLSETIKKSDSLTDERKEKMKKKRKEKLLKNLSEILADKPEFEEYKDLFLDSNEKAKVSKYFNADNSEKKIIIPNKLKSKKHKFEKLNSLILGDDDDLPFELNNLTIEEIKSMGGEVITEIDTKFHTNGNMDFNDKKKKEKLEKLMSVLQEDQQNFEEGWSDEEDSLSKKKT